MFSLSLFLLFFFFKQKTAYEMRISDWSSDVCSSDLRAARSASASAKRKSTGSQVSSENAVGSCARKRSEERRVGKSVSVRVDLGGRRIIKKKNKQNITCTNTTISKSPK